MSWLNLKRLLPSRKVWKLLKNKLPLKLHKISKSKANKKQPHQKISTKTTNKTSIHHPKKFKIRPNYDHHRERYYKSQKPVYIDQLFVKPVSGVHAPVEEGEEEAPGKGRSRSTIHMKKGGVLDRSALGGDHNMMSADDMWESMVLTSPHVHGIDERAEEFIARIKAEMRHQEMLARGL